MKSYSDSIADNGVIAALDKRLVALEKRVNQILVYQLIIDVFLISILAVGIVKIYN